MVILTTLLSSQNAHCANDDERRLSLWCLSSGILALINIHKSARFREFAYIWLSTWKHVIISESISPFQHKLLSAFPRVWRFTTTSSPENLFTSHFRFSSFYLPPQKIRWDERNPSKPCKQRQKAYERKHTTKHKRRNNKAIYAVTDNFIIAWSAIQRPFRLRDFPLPLPLPPTEARRCCMCDCSGDDDGVEISRCSRQFNIFH